MDGPARALLPAIVLCAAFLAGCAVQRPGLLPAGNTVAISGKPSPAAGCRFESAPRPVAVAFCETFDRPAGIGNRSGQLDGTLWGVSRLLGASNFGQQQFNAAAAAVMRRCGRNVTVVPPQDVAICDGRLVEAVNDNGGVTSLAMYPKQPFDIAGRTGTIVFDVSDDSKGSHRVWPELWYTDLPVPDPFVHLSSLQSTPENGFGVRFAAFCPPNVPGCGVRFVCPDEPESVGVVTVDSAVVVDHYRSDDSFTNGMKGTISVKAVGCVKASRGPGDMNHFELRVSHDRIDVYGTDAGTTSPLRKIAVISNMHLTLTRGLVWLEDAHYNADKAGFGPKQGIHTFTWDNVGFDGPLLPRDLAFDVLDRLQPVGTLLNLGWPVAPGAPLRLPVNGVYNVANAQAALLTFNYSPYDNVTLKYRVNRGAWQTEPWPFGACYDQSTTPLCGQKTIAVPVPLSDVKDGTNTVEFASTGEAAVYNVDIVLRAAAGLPSAPPQALGVQ